jgi:cytochrome P450
MCSAYRRAGPVVRITPDEVHLSDANNFEVMNCVGTKFAKSTQFYDRFGIGYSTFSTGHIDIHRIRRGMLDPFFSRRTVINLQSIVQARAEKLSAIMSAKFARNEAVDLHHAFRAISVDVITEYAFGQSYDLLDRDDSGVSSSPWSPGLARQCGSFSSGRYCSSLLFRSLRRWRKG